MGEKKKKQTTDETTRGVVSIDKVSSAAARDKFTFPFQRSCWEVVLGSAAVLRHRVSDGGRSSGRPQISRTRSLGLRESAKKKNAFALRSRCRQMRAGQPGARCTGPADEQAGGTQL